MTKQKDSRSGEVTGVPAYKRGVSIAIVSVLAVAIVASLGLWWRATRHTNKPSGSPPPIGAGAVPTAATAPAVPVTPIVDFQKLKGSWLRPDGGYVIQVRSVDDSGQMDASYLNPRQIHVAKAEASRDAGALRVFIELRDVNYPGSTYNLTYDPRSDSLVGIYYQAVEQLRFEVVFVRMQ